MIVRASREVLEHLPASAVQRLMYRVNTTTEEGLRARSAYVALRMIRERFSRAPQTVQEFEFHLSEQAVEDLAAEADTLTGHSDLTTLLKRQLKEHRVHAERKYERPKDRAPTRTTRSYGFRQ